MVVGDRLSQVFFNHGIIRAVNQHLEPCGLDRFKDLE
jgi:hypothetical protein